MEGKPLGLAAAIKLRNYADRLQQCGRDLRFAREHSTKPKHLYVQARRSAVQACRIIVTANKAGFDGLAVVSGDPTFPHNRPDGELTDDWALFFWKFFVCTELRSKSSTLKADAGAFDFPKVKTDEAGRVLGPDGEPIKTIEERDPETGELIGWKKTEAAHYTDDYDEADALEHLRAQSADWADCCDVTAELIRDEVMARTDKGEFPNPSGPEPGKSWKEYVDEQHDALELTALPDWEGPIPHDLPVVAAGMGRFLRRELGDLLELRRDGSSGAIFIQQGNILLRNVYRLLDNLHIKGAPPQPGEQRDANEIEQLVRNLSHWADPIDEQVQANETEVKRSHQIADLTDNLCKIVGSLDRLFRALNENDLDAAAQIHPSLFDARDGALVRAGRMWDPLMLWVRARSTGVAAFGLRALNFHELTFSLAARVLTVLESGKSSVSSQDFEVIANQVTFVRRDSDGNLDFRPILALLNKHGDIVRNFAAGFAGRTENLPWLESELKMESARFIELAQQPEALAPVPSDDHYPPTPTGHLAFVEWVFLEVREQAQALRDGKYTHESIAKQLKNGVQWNEAARRLDLLAETLGPATIESVARVLRSDLTIGTLLQISELLESAVRALRNAFENAKHGSNGVGTKKTPSSLVDVIGRVVRRLKAKPDLLRCYDWNHPDTLNADGINAAAGAVGLGPVFVIGEAPDWATAPNLPSDDPVNQRKVECLTVVHPDGNEYRIRRTGGQLDDPSSLPTSEVVACLEAWAKMAAERCNVAAPENTADDCRGPKRPKRSTVKGEGRAKLIPALTLHHKYAEGGCMNLEPIGNNALARLAEVAQRTASAFFRKEFHGHARYRLLCNDPPRLVAALKALNGEFQPHEFYDAREPAEVAREEDD